MARWLPRGEKRGPDTPSNPRRLTADPCNKVVSTLYTAESDLIGPVLGLPLSGLSLQGVSCIAEIILVTRYVELRSRLHRMISVLKVRDSEINSALHEFTVTKNGIVIAPDSTTAESILADAAGQGRHADLMTLPENARDGED